MNVKDFGAVGDGTTDDTTAINLAIAALNAAGLVESPPVTDLISQTIDIPEDD